VEAGVVFAIGFWSRHPFPAVSSKGQRRQLVSIRPRYRKRTPRHGENKTAGPTRLKLSCIEDEKNARLVLISLWKEPIH
jgi:hypothetical protein